MSSQSHIADVWILEQHTLTAADIARCNAAISPAEKARMRQLRFERDRDSYRAAHALARFALSRCETAVPPHAWVFEETAHGYGRLQTHSDEWHFEQWSPTPTHVVATAVRARGLVRLVRHWGIPGNR